MPSNNFKAPICFAMIEMNSQSDIYTNLVAIEYATHQAVKAGARFVIAPENAFSFGNHKLASQHFEALKNWCGQLAREYDVYFLAGTLPCPFRPDGRPVFEGKFRQTSLLFDPSGDCVARYDKIHLFNATVTDPEGNTTQYDEGKTFEAGNMPVVAKTALGNMGLMVCYDLRFAQLAKYLRHMGADILTAPSAFTYDTGKLHWQTLLQARALDSQCMLIGMGQTGTHTLPNGSIRKTWGHSQFIDANGQVMPMTRSQVNPFTACTDPIPFTTLLAKHALSWLNADTGNTHSNQADKTSDVPQTVTVYLTNFDLNEQTQFRQNINLVKSERFGLLLPMD